MATFTDGGSVDLFYNDSKKFETATNGISVTGSVISTANFSTSGITEMNWYNATNNANPTLNIGSSSAERLLIQSVYASGAQTLAKVSFRTYSSLGAADAGQYVFGVDEVDKFVIDDGGIEVTGDTDTDTLTVSGNGTVGGTLGVTGASTFSSTITIPDSIIHSGDTDTYMQFDAANSWRVVVGGYERFAITDSVVVNEDSHDADFRVESNGNANMLFVDGGNDRVGIGWPSPNAPLDIKYTDNANAQRWSYGSSQGGFYLELDTAIPAGGVVSYNFNLMNNSTAYNNNLVLDRGNVGIGTATPDEKLKVNGTFKTAGKVGLNAVIHADAQVNIYTGDATDNILRINAGSGSYTGTALEVQIARQTGESGYTLFKCISKHDNVSPATRFSVRGDGLTYINGSLGIGTTSPDDTLHVVGNVFIEGDSPEITFETTNSSYYNWQIAAQEWNSNSLQFAVGSADADASNDTFSPLMTITAAGNVGIGVPSPGHKLSVNGTSEFYNTMHMHSSSYLQWTGGEYWSIQSTNSSNDIRFTTVPSGGAEHFRIAENGTLTATDTTIGSNSDSRLKENIENYTYDINKFKSYEPRIFDWKNPSMHGNKSQQIGFIAQEQEIIDERFIDNIKLDAEDTVEDNPDIALIDEDRLMKTSKFGQKDAMYVSVIQQLITRLETAEARIEEFENG